MVIEPFSIYFDNKKSRSSSKDLNLNTLLKDYCNGNEILIENLLIRLSYTSMRWRYLFVTDIFHVTGKKLWHFSKLGCWDYNFCLNVFVKKTVEVNELIFMSIEPHYGSSWFGIQISILKDNFNSIHLFKWSFLSVYAHLTPEWPTHFHFSAVNPKPWIFLPNPTDPKIGRLTWNISYKTL